MLDLRSSECFSSLPAIIQESIIQSGVEFKNEKELKQFVSEYNVKNNKNKK